MTTTTPIVLYGFLRPRPERADELREILLSLVDPSRREAGNLQYHVHEQEDGRFFLYELWRSQQDLEVHNRYPALQALMKGLNDYVTEPPEAYLSTMISEYAAGRES